MASPDRYLSSLDQHLKSRGLLPQTRRQYSSIARRIGKKDPITWLHAHIDPQTPIGTVLPFRAAVKHFLIAQKGLSDEEAQVLLPKARGRSCRLRSPLSRDELIVYERIARKRGDPVRTILLLLPLTGMRIGEVCNLRTEEVDVRQGIRGFIFRGKGDKQRFVPLSTSASEILDEYLEDYHDGGDWLFYGYGGSPIRPDSLRKATREMSRGIPELEGLCPHKLRHTFATHAIRKGMDLKNLQVLLGHASIETTSRYLHPDAQMLFDALSVLED